MKITFLGTAAAEGSPALFCNCEHCKEARRLGGKNIRSRSQAIINDDLLIDFPADTYSHFMNNNIEGDKIKYLLVTHSHSDHFYDRDLGLRHPPYAHNKRTERFQIYCSEGTARKLEEISSLEKNAIDYPPLKPFDKVTFGSYEITALPARHFQEDGAIFYIIKGEKTILYAHDTGYFYPEVFDYIRDNGYVFDLATFDCTFVDLTYPDDANHMGIDNINRVVKILEDMGAINDKTKKVVNHFSHNGNPIQHRVEELVKDLGFAVSYDGLSIEI